MRPALQEILKDIQSLEPFPAVALKVLELSDQPEVVPGELTALIGMDAGLTAKVLKLSNSALYGCSREIASIHEAGTRLGTRVLTSLVLTGCAARHFRNYGAQDPAHVQRAWERSIANAIAASLLASISGAVDKQRAYTAALLQDIGQLVLERHCQREAAVIAAEIARGSDALQAEKSVLGLSHAEVGARLAARWKLPDVLVDTILCHHEPERARCDALLASFVHLGGQLAQLNAEHDTTPARAHFPLRDAAFVTSGIDALEFAAVEEALVQELAKAQELLQLA